MVDVRREWAGSYLDGRTATRRRAAIRIMGSGLEIIPEGDPPRWWPYGEIRQTQGFYAGEQVRLERGGEISEAVLLSDATFLASLREVAPQAAGRFHDPRRRRGRVRVTLGAAIVVVVIVAGLYQWGIPALARLAAARVPAAWEERFGEAAVDHLAPAEERCLDAAGAKALDTLVARLTRPLAANPYTFRVVVWDSPRVNAFASPGGYLVLLRGLLEHVRAPEELAGVMAHEVQHVLLQHPTRALLRHASTGLLVIALSGDPTGVMAYGLEAARSLGTLRHSREAEDEADVEGMRLLAAAKIDPRGMIAFLESLEKDGAQPAALTYLSTHPNRIDRLARLRRLVPAPVETPVPLLQAEEWAAIRAMCTRSAG